MTTLTLGGPVVAPAPSRAGWFTQTGQVLRRWPEVARSFEAILKKRGVLP